MLAILTLLLATAFPSTSKTTWMRPESFRLTIGMPRAEVVRTLADGGWTAKPGKDDHQMVIDYGNDKAVTLEFQKERLHSLRFELYALVNEARDAFQEEKAFLAKKLGKPKPGIRSRAIVLYDGTLPNVMVVLADDPKSEHGKQGLGTVVVRYYDPR